MHAAEITSIVIPVFNRVDLARQAVLSAVQQINTAIDLIVVDDGSEEDVTELARFVRHHNGRFVHSSHRGISAARNAGLELAVGECIAFLDSDDRLFPSKISSQTKGMSSEHQWSCSGYLVDHGQSDKGRCVTLEGLAPHFWESECPFGATSLLVKQDALYDVDGFDEKLDLSEDWDLVIRLGRRFAPHIYEGPLYTYRLGCGNVSKLDQSRVEMSWSALRSKHDLKCDFNYCK